MPKATSITPPSSAPERTAGPEQSAPRSLSEAARELVSNALPLSPGMALAMHQGAPVLVVTSLMVSVNVNVALRSGNPKLASALDVINLMRDSAGAREIFSLTRNTEAAIGSGVERLSTDTSEAAGHRARAIKRVYRFLSGHSNALPASSVSVIVERHRGHYAAFEAKESPLIINAREALDARISRLTREAETRGLRAAEEKHIKVARDALSKFERTIRFWGEGAEIIECRRAMKVSDKTLFRWFNGKLPEAIEYLGGRHPGGRVDPLKDLNLPRTSSLNWAYLLGAYQAVTSHRGVAMGLRFQHADKENIDRLAAVIEALDLGVNIKTGSFLCHGQERQYLRVASKGLARKLHDFSAANSRVVWEALGTPEEEREFLRGFCSFRGSFGSRCFHVAIAQHRVLAVQVAALFAHHGIRANTAFGDTVEVRIASYEGLQSLVAAEILPETPQRQIKDFLAAREAPRHYGDEDRARVDAHFKQFPKSTYVHAAEVTGISASSIREWKEEGVRPRGTWLQQLVDFSGFEVPHRFTAAYLFRNYGVSLEEARKMSLRWDLEQIKAAEKENEKLSYAPNKSRYELLKARLDRATTTAQQH